MLDEHGSVLGTISSGGLRLGDGARTLLVEADRSLRLSGLWSLKGYGSLGYTRVQRSDVSLFTKVSSAVSSRFGAAFEGVVAGGLLALGIAQPLNVEHGDATLRIGNGYDLDSRSLTFDDRRVSLSGSRRMIMSTGYERMLGAGRLRFGIADEVTTNRGMSALVSYALSL